MKREQVFKIVSKEREYQEAQTSNPDRVDMLEHFSMGDALSAIQYNLDQCRSVWYKEGAPYNQSSHYLRKIAALCVKMGERYGMEER